MSDIRSVDPASMAQDVRRQPDGPGLRIGKRAEVILFGKVIPGGEKLYRERIGKFQAEAAYWEERVGTVHDFRILMFDDDKRLLFLITYDGDFKPYVVDIIRGAGKWFDDFMPGVWEGFVSADHPSTVDLVLAGAMPADFFYVSNPELTVRDITRMKKLSRAFGEVLDAAG